MLGYFPVYYNAVIKSILVAELSCAVECEKRGSLIDRCQPVFFVGVKFNLCSIFFRRSVHAKYNRSSIGGHIIHRFKCKNGGGFMMTVSCWNGKQAKNIVVAAF